MAFKRSGVRLPSSPLATGSPAWFGHLKSVYLDCFATWKQGGLLNDWATPAILSENRAAMAKASVLRDDDQ